MPAVDVLDSTLTYRDVGTGSPIVFLHGNPTSSYLWRGVLAASDGPGRRLAPDLIGMGDSGRPPVEYRFADHAHYLDAWFDALDLDGVILVGHDWGGALAFDWAARHPGRVRGIAFMETIVRPMSLTELPEAAQERFKAFRTPEVGESLVLDQNIFIEQFPRIVLAELTDADMDAYRKPFPTPESRLPLLAWPRELPFDGEPANVVERIEAYDAWLAQSPEVPKLLLTFEPGPAQLMGPELVDWCAANIAGLEIERLGPAGHHAPEDQPEAIAAAIIAWADRHELLSDGPAAGGAGASVRPG
jgi:haloalkane dehalogenase